MPISHGVGVIEFALYATERANRSNTIERLGSD